MFIVSLEYGVGQSEDESFCPYGLDKHCDWVGETWFLDKIVKFCLNDFLRLFLELSSEVHTCIVNQLLNNFMLEEESSFFIAEKMYIEKSSSVLAGSIDDS